MAKKRALGCLFLGLSLALTLVVAEAALRFASSRWLSVFDVEMWQYARKIKLESKLPGVVEEQRPNASAWLMGTRVRTDEHGFRRADPATEAARRPDDRLVVALGDSVTFGWGAPEGETFPDQLERLLATRCPAEGECRATVYNAGIGNCNSSMEVARYAALIRPLHPSWVILGYSYNDPEPDPVPEKSPLFWHSALLSLAAARLERVTGRYSDYQSYYKGLYDDGRPGWVSAQRAIRELGALLAKDGTEATMVLLPELHEPYRFGSFAGIFAKAAEVGRESGFEVIDPSGDFPPGPGQSFWVSREDAHPNARGQAIIAAALARSAHACQ